MEAADQVEDREVVGRYLGFIGYFRLSAYCVPFLIGGSSATRQNFKPHTYFEKILELYVFDRKLRLLAMDAVERIEVAVKAVITNAASVNHGSHWFLKHKFFTPTFDHNFF